MIRKVFSIVAVISIVSLAAVGHAAPPGRTAPAYRLLKEIPIGGDGGWDYLSLDEKAHRLYVAHESSYAVIDTRLDTFVGTVADTPGAHGFAVVPRVGRGFATNGHQNTVSVVDLKTMMVLSKIVVGDKPDSVLYAVASRRVYAFNGDGMTASVIDPKTAKVIATIELGGEPEFAVEDAARGGIYCNLENTNEIVRIDEKTNAVVARWSLAPGATPTGLALDVKHQRLFAGCRNGMVVAVDATSGRALATWPIGQKVDACRYDPELGLVFASCGDGTVTIARQDNPDAYTVVQTLTTAPGAKTMTLDPKTHRIYLATAELRAAAEPPPGETKGKPTPVPGTFKVMVYGPK
jgi:YVTN family beta-propeller protein